MATLGELIIEARIRADDNVAPYLADDTAFARWATEAEREACIRARLLFDDSDRADVTTIAVTAGQHTYPIDPLVGFVDAASFLPAGGVRSRDLELRGLDWIRDHHGWQSRTSSRPSALADNGRDQMRIWPTTSVDGTLRLAVYRYPLLAMEDPSDEPEIREEHHAGLVDWMMFRYWSQKDSENQDPERAAAAKADFVARFGERNTAEVMRRHRERRRVTTRYGGIR